MRTFYMVLMALVLAGCATPREIIVTRTVTVEVPITAKCTAPMPERPTYELDRVTAKNDVYEKGRAALVEIQQRKAYEEKLHAAAKACR